MGKKQEVNFRSRNLVFVDVETTGRFSIIHEIIEIAAVVVTGGEFRVIDEYTFKVKPLHIERADPKALEINGYSKRTWRSAPLLEEVLPKFNDLAADGMLAGWNISFDWAFLENAFVRLNIEPEFDYHRLDVMSIAFEKLYPTLDVKSLSLRKVASYLGISLPEIHRALDDSRATYEVFKKLMQNEN